MAIALLPFLVGGSLWLGWRKTDNRVYRIAANRTSQYVTVSAGGAVSGLTVDVLEEAARRSGLRFRWVPLSESPDNGFQKDLIDIYPSATMSDWRRKNLHMTPSWLVSSMMLVAPAERPIASLALAAGRKIAVRFIPGLEAQVARDAPGVRLVETPRMEDGLAAMCRGEVAGTLLEARYMGTILLNPPAACGNSHFSVVSADEVSIAMHLASSFGAAGAADRLHEAIVEMMDDGTLSRIIHRWSPFTSVDAYSQEMLKVMSRRSTALAWGMGGLLVVALTLGAAFRQTRNAQRAAHRASAVKSEFLANMSHEIRTPMNAIVGMAGLLTEMKLPAEAADFANIIRTSSDALLTILNDILDLSKIEAGRLELEQAPFLLRACMEDAMALLAPGAGGKGLELACDVGSEVPKWLSGDVTRLRQILLNLAGNAVKFTRAGEVVLSVHGIHNAAGEARLRFCVRDTGPGISEDRQKDLFQSFSQLDASTTRRFGGTGLGLAISKQLVELMGGEIGVKSKLGEGSNFWFEIPQRAAPDQVDPESVAPGWQGVPALVVDDNSTNRRILAKSLSNWGFQVAEAASGAEAIEQVDRAVERSEALPEVILMDFLMPGMNGVEVAQVIARKIPTAKMMLLTSTSAGIDELLADDQANPFQAIVRKPVRSGLLKQTLANVLPTPAVVAERPVAKVAPAEVPAEVEPSTLRILLAEDNLVNQKVAVALLKKLGFSNVMVVSNGRVAVDAVLTQNFDLVLLDLQMPEMDGLKASAEICRQLSSGSRPRIVALTANALKGDREMCLTAGMDDYLSKPLRLGELRAALERCRPVAPDAGRQGRSWIATRQAL